MRIYARMIPLISREIIARLSDEGDIEVDEGLIDEAELDVGAVMRQYLEDEHKLNDEVKDRLDRLGRPYSDFARFKKVMAEEQGFKLGDDAIDYVINQMLEFFLVSRNIEEVYSEDHEMRRKIVEILRKYLMVDEEIDREARARIKNLQEGTPQWEIEYEKTVSQLKRSRGLI